MNKSKYINEQNEYGFIFVPNGARLYCYCYPSAGRRSTVAVRKDIQSYARHSNSRAQTKGMHGTLTLTQ